MSKMLRAMKKADEFHKSHFSIEPPQDTQPHIVHHEEQLAASNPWKDFIAKFGVGNLIILFMITLLTASTIYISAKIAEEFKKAKEISIALSNKLYLQHDRINQLESNMAAVEKEKDARLDELDSQFTEITAALQKKQDDIDNMAVDYNILRTKINELNSANHKLMDRYMNLARQVDDLKNVNVAAVSNVAVVSPEVPVN